MGMTKIKFRKRSAETESKDKAATRRKFLTGAGVAAAGAATMVAAPNVSRAQTVTLKMQGSWGAKSIFSDMAAEYVDRVQAMAGGRLKIDYLAAGAVETLLATRLEVGPSADASSKPVADRVGEVVARECAERPGDDDEGEPLVAQSGCDTTDDDRCLAGHDRDDRVEQCDREDDEEEPPIGGHVVERIGEIGDDVRDHVETLSARRRARDPPVEAQLANQMVLFAGMTPGVCISPGSLAKTGRAIANSGWSRSTVRGPSVTLTATTRSPRRNATSPTPSSINSAASGWVIAYSARTSASSR